MDKAEPSPSETVSVPIARSRDEVYRFVAEPSNMSHWAAGLGAGFERRGDTWTADTPSGRVEVRFAPINAFGVVDHWVRLPSGDEVYVPLRVVPNGRGSEVMLTVFRRPGMSDPVFAQDVAAVRRDLAALRDLLERQ
jgi:hypothetical protein